MMCYYLNVHFHGQKVKTLLRHRHVCKLKLISRSPSRRQLVEFNSGTLICRTDNSAGPAACENIHLFTLHPAPESDPTPGFTVVCASALSVLRICKGAEGYV